MEPMDLRHENHGLTVWNPWTYGMKTMDKIVYKKLVSQIA
jgi:D-hexose-6-phosphate mutarotase